MNRIIINSIMRNGGCFRPSDWVERLCTQIAGFGPDHRIQYPEGIHPAYINGEKCLVMSGWVRESNPMAFDFILSFATSNGLRIRND